LGYSLTGDFSVDDMPDDVAWWLRGYNYEIQNAIDRDTRATHEISKLWADLIDGNAKAGKATTVVDPLIRTKWNQNIYYNRLCPEASGGPDGHALTGCVATAMAQVMKYWNYPSYGVGSHSYNWNGQTLTADFAATNYDWENMAETYYAYYVNPNDQYAVYAPNHTDTEITAVATLMYHCGVSVDMNYGGGGSGAFSNDVAPALRNYFNYSSTVEYKRKSSTNTNANPWVTTTYYSDSEWITILKNELDASRPIVYGGADPNALSGHSFVCDGYDNRDYFHFNWGWAGHYNGYFTITNLNTGANNESGSGNGTYTRDQDITIGIQPGSMIDAPSNLTYTLNGLNNISLTWSPVSAAASYNVYRNGNFIGNTTETTFSEEAPFGELSYYVRCIDANGQLSLPSNAVAVTIAYQTPIVTDLTATLSENEVNLSWTAPEWCYPETPSATLTYGSGNYTNNSLGYNNGSNLYWGHRFPANVLTSYNNMSIYKAAFYSNEAGSYKACVYKGTVSGHPQTLLLEQTLNIGTNGWFEFDLSDRLTIDASKDYWIFIYDPNGRSYPATYCSYSGSEGNYYSSAPTSWVSTQNDVAFLIKTFVTDGTYTYNLYDGTTQLASGLTETTYTHTNPASNAAHQYTVKTNYYGGESAASNMAGLTLGTASLSSLELGENDKMNVTAGSELTVSGTLTNTNPANLILENGAELVHNSANVKATVKKTVTPPSADDYGWYFIASPVTETVTPSADNGFLNGAYDLYYYDEPTHYWMNYENSPFNINHQKGYLYANDATDGTTLQFAGTLTPSNSSVTINNLSHSASLLNGFNLVGNPFACNATVGEDFYVVDNAMGKVILASNTAEIAPCAGIFVKATENDASVTFTKATSSVEPSSSSFDIVVKRAAQPTRDGVSAGSTTLDRARVRLSDSETLEKFSIGDGEGSVIYFPQNGQDLVVACANGQNEMPLNFKATENGTYTLSFEVDIVDLDYLHLIDNMTGDEVDVLAMPTYTFEAKTSDYASRFRLVFAENKTDGDSTPSTCSGTGSAAFASIADGEIHINEADAHGASLQVIDALGRVILTGDAINRVSTSGMAPGVYVLRLINGDSVRTQRIVIE